MTEQSDTRLYENSIDVEIQQLNGVYCSFSKSTKTDSVTQLVVCLRVGHTILFKIVIITSSFGV